jgi:pimeloyl-ACP methyl ester carboxylesterase
MAPAIPGGEGIYERFMERVWQPLARAFSESGVPTLLLSGASNQGFNRLIDGHLEQLLRNGQRVIIPEASHEMFLDAPALTAAAILDFIRQH